MVPIRQIFHTDISLFVKFAQVSKLYVAYMRNLQIDIKKNTPDLLIFALDSKYSHICQDFITWFKQVTDIFICFTVEQSGTGVRLQINYMRR